MTQSATLTCYVHPNRETSLRCNRCERPICAQCAVRTPTGYRCKECVRIQQKTFDTALWYDYLLGFALAGVLSAVASAVVLLVSFLGLYFMLLISAGVAWGAGRIIADTLLRVIRRRARALYWAVAAGVILGALPAVIIQLLSLNLFGLIGLGIYVVIATPIVYSRFSGIQL
jgi:hypothetical protein